MKRSEIEQAISWARGWQDAPKARQSGMKKTFPVLLLTLIFSLALCACALAGDFTLPAGLRTVEDYAFYGDTALTEVTVPKGVKTIGEKAFADTGLKRIDLPATVTSIADSAFDGITDLKIAAPSDSYARQYADSHENITWISNAAVLPDAPLTRDNILTLLDDIDPDGAYIVRNSDEDDLLVWFSGAETIGDGMNSLHTAVHEQCHDYCGTNSGFMYSSIQGKYLSAREWIYTGDGQHIEVTFTDVFPSSEMVSTVPDSLKTYRFDTYVDGDASMASIQYGIYGLMDEFTAYCWGNHNMVTQVSYRQDNGLPGLPNSNQYLAYAEFRYYILHYMLYAKDHYPDVYTSILNNASLRSAFRTIDNKFAVYAEHNKNYYALSDWNALMTEMQKTEYVSIASLLKK
ncbi:MAG: leucine-rich repeat domain-containing protein [Clostridia bacterium]|nr:leucine-rich repeat domain-containing protein [Clostridia bacterium]